MDAQAMLGFFEVRGIDGGVEHLEILRIVEKTHIVFHLQERGEIPGEYESDPRSEVQKKLCAGAKFCRDQSRCS